MHQPIHLYFGARGSHDVYGLQQLDALVRAHPRLSHHVVLSAANGRSAFREGFVHERSEEHTSELQSPMRNSYAVFCLKKKNSTRARASGHNINILIDTRNALP